MDEEVAVAEQASLTGWGPDACLICGKTMWEPEPPSWFDFYGNQCGSLSPLLAGMTLDQHLRVSLCDNCLTTARDQGRVCIVTRNQDERSSRVWGQ